MKLPVLFRLQGGPGRVGALDAARGFAVLAVVAAHATLLRGPAAGWIYEFYVPLFFVLAGYLAAPGGALRRIGRVAGQYFGVSLTLFAIWFAAWPLRGRQTELVPRALASIAYGRFYAPGQPLLTDCCWSGQLWFCTLLCTGTALFYLVRRVRGAVGQAAVLAALLAAAQLLRQAPVLLPWCLDTAPLAAAYLLGGSWLARLDFARRPLRGAGPALLAVCLAAYVLLHDTYDLNLRVYGQWQSIAGPAAFFAAGMAGSVLCIAVCAAAVRVPGLRHILCWAGQHSMEIFCWHVFWLWVLDLVRTRLSGAGAAGLALYAVLVLAAVPAACAATGLAWRAAAGALRRRLRRTP